MAEAVPPGVGAMAALFPTDVETARAVAAAAVEARRAEAGSAESRVEALAGWRGDPVCEVANVNSSIEVRVGVLDG